MSFQAIDDLTDCMRAVEKLTTAIRAALLTLETTPTERRDEAVEAIVQILRGALIDGSPSSEEAL